MTALEQTHDAGTHKMAAYLADRFKLPVTPHTVKELLRVGELAYGPLRYVHGKTSNSSQSRQPEQSPSKLSPTPSSGKSRP